MNPTYIGIELTRQARDWGNLMFVIALPVAMYLLFGTQTDAATQPAGHGNVAFYVLVSMAFYGAALATTSISGTAATENMQGWGRQVALTRAPRIGFILNKVAVAVLVALAAMALVYAVGSLTGAKAGVGVWLASFAISLSLMPLWGIYGLAVGLLFRSETAVGIASAALTFFGFFGNLFLPLSGVLLDIAKFTPMYGAAALVRWPTTEGALPTGGTDPLWLPLANVGAWATIFAGLAVLGVRRSTSRQ